MDNISNKQLSNQIVKLDAKIEVLMALLERNEKTMFSFFGNQRNLIENLTKIEDTYKGVRKDLKDYFDRVDKLYEATDNGSGEL